MRDRSTGRKARVVGLRGGCVAALVFGYLAVPVVAQQAGPGFNENVVFVDAAHGGTDAGAHLGGAAEEKDVTLALADRLRGLLAEKGFSVVGSRDGDATVTAEQRAGVGNHARPLACILLHATLSDGGVALAVSALTPETEQKTVLPWGTAQASYVSQSLALREIITGSLTTGKFRPVSLRASVPPIDSLACAAVTLEVAGSKVTDGDYQQRVAEAVSQAVVAWRAQVAPRKTTPAVPSKAPLGSSGSPGGVVR